MNLTDRFLKYVSFDTTSDSASPTCPSTEKQKVLGAYLADEMKSMGIADAHMDADGYVYGTLPGNIENKDLPVLGFIAHMDTVDDCAGANIKPSIVHYEGGDIVLNAEKNIVMRAGEFENLKNYVGKDLIVTDGTTLLGCDDKGGVAEIMTAAEYLLNHPEIKHGTIKIGFTPDEEIGRGADRFDVAGFGADFAYTVDGGSLGELEYENFNAASAQVIVHGVNIHPGSAKNKMVNSMQLAMEFHAMLPVGERPELTEGYEGFSHLNGMHGDVEQTEMHYIIRDHDRTKFEIKKARFDKIAAYMNEKYGAGTVEAKLTDSYANMKEKIEPHMHLIDTAIKAMNELGIEPKVHPIRGGTDGARLSYMGLPCPNFCTGGENFHGRYEFVCVQSMEKCVQLVLKLIELYAGK